MPNISRLAGKNNMTVTDRLNNSSLKNGVRITKLRPTLHIMVPNMAWKHRLTNKIWISVAFSKSEIEKKNSFVFSNTRNRIFYSVEKFEMNCKKKNHYIYWNCQSSSKVDLHIFLSFDNYEVRKETSNQLFSPNFSVENNYYLHNKNSLLK